LVCLRRCLAEVISSVLSSIDLLIRYGEAILSGVPITDVLMSKDTVVHFVTAARELLFYRDRLYTGLPTNGMMCQKAFHTRASDLITTGEYELKNMLSWDTRKVGIRDLVRDLKSAVADIDADVKAKNRKPPIGVVLSGDPGIGKSKLLIAIARIWSDVKGRDFEDSHIFF